MPRLKIAGTFASECPDERIARLMLSPERHAAAAFDAMWRQFGGSIDGRVLLGSVPADAEPFHTAESQPLGEIIRTINKYSDNLMARMLFMELGVARDGPPGSVEKSRAVLADWLAERGFDFPGFYIDNGSGLSRDTRISAAALGELLVWAYHQAWMPELMASLAIMEPQAVF
jgi:D-alanyl-D-alanine carboxypeptidase/D-alanyl-D-alanine-endopeptidase (penicillin-binding protein 4)